MSGPSVVVQRFATAALPVLDPVAWRDDLRGRQRAGARLLTLFGRRLEHGDVLVSSVFHDPADSALRVTRSIMRADVGYHELTSELPAAHCFERELHEQTGLRIGAHPWLKPIRYEAQSQAAMAAHPFYSVEGKEVHEIAVGPIHAGVIEPGSFRFMCHGERVHHLEIQLGYQHRGVEKLLLRGDPRRLAPLVETIAGDSSVAHAWAHCAAIESLAACELDLESEIARAILLELERVAMHLACLAGMAADIGFLQGATTYGRLRTTAINTSLRVCGSRFGRGALRPGGVKLHALEQRGAELAVNLDLLTRDLAIINSCFLEARTVRHRLQGVGTLARAQAEALGVVGVAARASGVPIDMRDQMRHGAYRMKPIDPQLLEEGDCWARARLRIAEIDASLHFLAVMLAIHGARTAPRKPVGPLAAGQLAIATVEGCRGEVVHAVETGEDGSLVHYKVQDPSLRNWMGLAIAMRDNEISDFPICNKSFDLSYCGNDL